MQRILRTVHDVEILDLLALGCDKVNKINNKYRFGISAENEILDRINKIKPDVIGISCNYTFFANDAFELADFIKKHFKHVRVILGGAHASMDADNILKSYFSIDVVVRGEGEITFKELLDSYEHNTDLASIDGISFRKQGSDIVISNKNRKLIDDIDSLPEPARDLLDMETYKALHEKISIYSKSKPILSILTSRGCPYNCVFCSSKVVWDRLWRPRSPEKVVGEIEYLISTYGIKEVAIYDDQFLADRKRVIALCDLIVKRNLNITLSNPSGVSGWLLDEEVLIKMRMAGFYRLSLSIETGNENTLKFIKKRVDLNKILNTIKIANRLGFWLQSFFIIGFPYETKEDILKTINYAINSNIDYAVFIIAQPFKGADMYDIYKMEGLLKSDYVMNSSSNTMGNALCDSKVLKANEIEELRVMAGSLFLRKRLISYLYPSNLFGAVIPKIFYMKGSVRYAVKMFFAILKLHYMGRLTRFFHIGQD